MSAFQRLRTLSIVVLFFVGSADAQQVGPEIRVGPKEVTIGGGGIKNGKVTAPTASQLADNVINSHPILSLLSEADKKNAKTAMMTTGLVAVTLNPVTGIIIIAVLANGESRDIPVPTADVPPTGKNWALKATCVVQQETNLITAMFNEDPPNVEDIKRGDTIDLTAAYCPEYTTKSVTAAKIKVTGFSHPKEAPPLYRHYIVGKPI